MEFEQLQAFVMVLIGGCALIASISGACAAVVKFWRYAHKDSEKNADELDKLKQDVAGYKAQVDRYLSSDKRRIERLENEQGDIDEQMTLMLEALISILDHEMDGENHREKLEESRNSIDRYLIRRRKKTNGSAY